MGKRPAGRHGREPMATRQQRWMSQVVETDDGLPFIGEHAHREFIATGFCGNGCTLGTLSAMMARDRYFDRQTSVVRPVPGGSAALSRRPLAVCPRESG